MKPLLLITNDDGIHSPGLRATIEAVHELGELLIAAPNKQQTGMGRSFPRTAEVGKIREVPFQIGDKKIVGYSVHGSPAFAVAHGVLELADRKPDLCISGINYGENVGMVLSCSGTVGAILEACSHRIPGIAISLEVALEHQRRADYQSMNWEYAKAITRKWVEIALSEGIPHQAELLNINIPDRAIEPEEYRITRQSRQNYFEFVKPKKRELSEAFALKSRKWVEDDVEVDSDIYAIHKDRITSVTPLTWDMTK